MNRQKSIAVFAVIAAVAMTSIGLSGVSATPLMVSSVPQNQEGWGMLGHVEYTLMNDSQIKGYYQSDNVVVDNGKNCVANLVFGASPAGGTTGDNCQASPGQFTFIGIGNGTGASAGASFLDVQQLTNATEADLGCAGDVAATGELARRAATVTMNAEADAGGTTGAKVQLITTVPFDFVTANATIVHESAIFNGASLGDAAGDDACNEATGPGDAGVDWDMFSIQRLNPTSGITVTDGDSLSVKWTITIG